MRLALCAVLVCLGCQQTWDGYAAPARYLWLRNHRTNVRLLVRSLEQSVRTTPVSTIGSSAHPAESGSGSSIYCQLFYWAMLACGTGHRWRASPVGKGGPRSAWNTVTGPGPGPDVAHESRREAASGIPACKRGEDQSPDDYGPHHKGGTLQGLHCQGPPPGIGLGVGTHDDALAA